MSPSTEAKTSVSVQLTSDQISALAWALEDTKSRGLELSNYRVTVAEFKDRQVVIFKDRRSVENNIENFLGDGYKAQGKDFVSSYEVTYFPEKKAGEKGHFVR